MSKHKVNRHERPKAVAVARSNRAQVAEHVANREIPRGEVADANRPPIPRLAPQWSEKDAAIAAEKHVVDGCDRTRVQPKPTPAPAPTGYIDPDTLRLASRLTHALGLMAVFIAGLALGKML